MECPQQSDQHHNTRTAPLHFLTPPFGRWPRLSSVIMRNNNVGRGYICQEADMWSLLIVIPVRMWFPFTRSRRSAPNHGRVMVGIWKKKCLQKQETVFCDLLLLSSYSPDHSRHCPPPTSPLVSLQTNCCWWLYTFRKLIKIIEVQVEMLTQNGSYTPFLDNSNMYWICCKFNIHLFSL